MTILDYFILFVVLFLILAAMKNVIKEKGNCTYCAHKETCTIFQKKDKKNHTDRGECIEK